MATAQITATKEYRDLDLNFTIHPIKKDINKHTAEMAVINSIKNLVLTQHYEVPFQPEIGCNIRALLFEPADPITIADLRQAITDTITNHEPRVTLLDLVIEDLSDNNAYNVRIVYQINMRQDPVQLDVILERLR